MLHPDVARELQEKNLKILSRHKGGFQFIETFFPYTSGEIGPYYVQSGVVQNNGFDFEGAVSNMTFMVKQTLGERPDDTIISGGESRDWIFSIPIAARLRVPHTMIYKDGSI